MTKFDSDDKKRLLGIESQQEFVQDSKNEPEEVETESGSDEFDASGYYVGKKVKPRVYEFSDCSVPFSGFGILLTETETETETDSSSYDSDATSKPSSFRDEFNNVESELTPYKHHPSGCVTDGGRSMANNSDSGAETETRERKFFAVRDFPPGCGVGTANLINYQGFDSDDKKRLLDYESQQEFVQDSKNEPEEVETESGSDEFDASGYYVGKKVKPRVYELSDCSVPFSGFGILLNQTLTTETHSDSESTSYDSDATSKPSDDPSGYLTHATKSDSAAETQTQTQTQTRKRKFYAVRDFPPGCGVGAANLIDADAERLQSRCFKRRRNVWYKRPAGCGTSTEAFIEPRTDSDYTTSPATTTPCFSSF